MLLCSWSAGLPVFFEPELVAHVGPLLRMPLVQLGVEAGQGARVAEQTSGLAQQKEVGRSKRRVWQPRLAAEQQRLGAGGVALDQGQLGQAA